MLGYVFANKIGKHVGDTVTIDGHPTRSPGIYRTNVSFGNSTVMFPLAKLQALNRLSGQVSLGFVQVRTGASIPKVRTAIDAAFPQLTTIQQLLRLRAGRPQRHPHHRREHRRLDPRRRSSRSPAC